MIRVLIVDDHQDFSLAISEMLNLEPEISVLGTLNRGEDVLSFLEMQPVDIVLMDIRLGENCMNGVDTTRKILSAFPGMGIIILTGSNKDIWVEECLQAGISGYLTKHTPLDQWVHAISEVFHGKTYFCSIAQKVKQKPPEDLMLKRKINSYAY